MTQLPTPTPQFAFFVNLPQYIKEPYRRFLENNMRERWDFQEYRFRFSSASSARSGACGIAVVVLYVSGRGRTAGHK